jgi:hypothetical protein
VRRPWAALGFAVAAALSAWNPLAAPFGLVTGVGATILAVRALRRPGHRALATTALGVALAAVLGSAAVLALTAGVGRGPGGADVVPVPPPSETKATLDDAEARTRDARARARSELEALPRDEARPAPPAPRK